MVQMTIAVMAMVAATMIVVAAYAQLRVPEFTEGSQKVLVTRAVLIAVGIAFGLLSAVSFPEPVTAVLAFLIGFGTVHVPAAFILLAKHERGSGKS